MKSGVELCCMFNGEGSTFLEGVSSISALEVSGEAGTKFSDVFRIQEVLL